MKSTDLSSPCIKEPQRCNIESLKDKTTLVRFRESLKEEPAVVKIHESLNVGRLNSSLYATLEKAMSTVTVG